MAIHMKAIPLQARTGPEGSGRLRLPDFKTTAHEGGEEYFLVLISIVLCYKLEGRCFDPSWCHWIFH